MFSTLHVHTGKATVQIEAEFKFYSGPVGVRRRMYRKGLFEGFKNFKKKLFGDKAMLDRYFDSVSIVSVGGILLPVYTLSRKYMEATEPSKLEEKIILVGQKTNVDQVEHYIRRKLGETIKPFYLFKWGHTDIVKIEKKDQFEKLKDDKTPKRLFLCTSTEIDHSKETFFLPDDQKDLPKDLTVGNIVVVYKATDDDEKIKKSAIGLRDYPQVLGIFRNTKIMKISANKYPSDIQTEAALVQLSICILAALVAIIRK